MVTRFCFRSKTWWIFFDAWISWTKSTVLFFLGSFLDAMSWLKWTHCFLRPWFLSWGNRLNKSADVFFLVSFLDATNWLKSADWFFVFDSSFSFPHWFQTATTRDRQQIFCRSENKIQIMLLMYENWLWSTSQQ